ncbi:MAG: 30S ribosomal protein S16 [Lentimicrobium sp.]|nr:30S ribosomal protein S16 [Lentimicrobium sp.]
MPTKMRLQRHGKKGRPVYHIVIADGRAPRDGKFIEKIGTYNPVSKPAEINLDFQKAYEWFIKGADPTPTVKSILSQEGVLHYNHLMKGVAKGAFTKEIAEVRFNEWKESKVSKLSSAEKAIEIETKTEMKKRFEAEVKINEVRAADIAKKRLQEAKAAAGVSEESAEEAEVAPEEIAVVEDAPVTEVVAEETLVAEATEEPVAEATEEPAAEETKDTAAEETKETAAE